MNYNVKPMIVLPFALVFVLCLMAVVPTGTSEPLTDSGSIDQGYSKTLLIGSWSESYEMNFKVTSNATIDVYVLTSTEYSNYPYSFNPTYSMEQVKSATFKVKASAQEGYYLVIDNQDNSRSTDQVPVGPVTYSAEYPDVMDQITDTVDTAISMCMIMVVLVVVVIVVVIVLIIYFVTRKKSPPPAVVAPPMAYQPPQQPYVQPQQPYQQPPAQYAPPPPSPYEPPPPPPPAGQQYPPQPR